MKNLLTEELRLKILEEAEARIHRYGNKKNKSQLATELAFVAGLEAAREICDTELLRKENDPDKDQKYFDHGDDTAYKKAVKTIRRQIESAIKEIE